MSIQLTSKEQVMLGAVISEMGGVPNVDFNKIAEKTGHAYSRNARSAFIKIWDKLKAASTEDGDGATTPAENGGKRKRQPKAATSRKDSNQLLGMYKLEGGKRAKKEQTKKPAKEESEESAKTEDHESDTKLSHDNDSEDGKSTPVPYQTPSPKEGNDEWWDADSQDAAVMGVSVEAYRAAVAYPTTPTGAGLSDDEA